MVGARLAPSRLRLSKPVILSMLISRSKGCGPGAARRPTCELSGPPPPPLGRRSRLPAGPLERRVGPCASALSSKVTEAPNPIRYRYAITCRKLGNDRRDHAGPAVLCHRRTSAPNTRQQQEAPQGNSAIRGTCSRERAINRSTDHASTSAQPPMIVRSAAWGRT